MSIKDIKLSYLKHTKLIVFDVLMLACLILTTSHTSDLLSHFELVQAFGLAAAVVTDFGIMASTYISLDSQIGKGKYWSVGLAVLLIVISDGANTNYYLRHLDAGYGLWDLDPKFNAWVLGAFLPIVSCFVGLIRGVLHNVYYPSISKTKVTKVLDKASDKPISKPLAKQQPQQQPDNSDNAVLETMLGELADQGAFDNLTILNPKQQRRGLSERDKGLIKRFGDKEISVLDLEAAGISKNTAYSWLRRNNSSVVKEV